MWDTACLLSYRFVLTIVKYMFVTACTHLPKAYRLLLLGLECRGDLLRPVEEGSGVVMMLLSPRNASPFGLA